MKKGINRLFHSEVDLPALSDKRQEVDVDEINSSREEKKKDSHVKNAVQDSTTPPSPNHEMPSSDQLEKNVQVILEAVNQNPYDLSYTCLLIPRFNSHYLMGDIVDSLHTWIKQICISYGWYLEFINVRPEYLQWAIRVPPATSTAYFMKIIRQQTSLRIFEDFPKFRRDIIAKDFWAPGYMIIFGAQPHPVDSIRQYIHQTRQQQGILPDG